MPSNSDSFLRAELLENKNIVTYRLLSRKRAIHVNTAKNDLATFYEQNRDSSCPVYATFLLSGDVKIHAAEDEMDVDGSEASDVTRQKMILVGEESLEETKASFSSIRSCHVYALSASPPLDVDALYSATLAVREIDLSSDGSFLNSVGKVVGEQVKAVSVGKPRAISTNTAKTQAAIAKSTLITKPKAEEKTDLKPAASENPKPKATGKLDWSKAKPKEPKKEPQVKAANKPVETPKSSKVIAPAQQRGTKRKSDAFFKPKDGNDSAAEVPKLVCSPGPSSFKTDGHASSSNHAKRGVILSDDDDDEIVVKPKPGRRVKTELPDDELDPERSVRAMMDVDDSEVVKASRTHLSLSKEEESEEEDDELVAPRPLTEPPQGGDVDMDDDSDPAPKPKPRKRKEKKTIPIGKNGYKKKRVMKSRMKVDEKGYMVTEDYSSYESVDEEEAEAEIAKAKAKNKSKPRKEAVKQPVKQSQSDSEGETAGNNQESLHSKSGGKTAPKPAQAHPKSLKSRPSTNGQKNIMSFFGSSGGKTKK